MSTQPPPPENTGVTTQSERAADRDRECAVADRDRECADEDGDRELAVDWGWEVER